ncbi:MAG: hypothetical protein Q7R68_10830 [Nitrospirales bacterium]|nr:hypothetical protein [Nitrospirales bacterium]
MDHFTAVSIAEGFCGGENASREEQIEAWQYLIDTGLAWSLQGWFGRTASALIEQGLCHAKGVGV